MPHLYAAAHAQRRQGRRRAREPRLQGDVRLTRPALAQRMGPVRGAAAAAAPIMIHHLVAAVVAAQACEGVPIDSAPVRAPMG